MRLGPSPTLLAFTSVYFSESSLFNALQAIQIKIVPFAVPGLNASITCSSRSPSVRLSSGDAFLHRKIDNMNSEFRKSIVAHV